MMDSIYLYIYRKKRGLPMINLMHEHFVILSTMKIMKKFYVNQNHLKEALNTFHKIYIYITCKLYMSCMQTIRGPCC